MSETAHQKKLDRLWHALEVARTAPDSGSLLHLSGIFEEDLARFERAWGALEVAERRRLLESLVRMAENDVQMDFTAIFRLAMDDADAQVRVSAIEGLWEDEDVRLIPRLVAHLLEDEVEDVRVASAQCLGHFVLLGELGKIRPRPYAVSCEALVKIYRNPEEPLEVRRRALESLSYAGLPEVLGFIQEAYANPDETMQLSAVFAMGRSADPRWKATVRRRLGHPDPAMRYEAARASGELGDRDAVHDLIDLADDVDAEVQEAALWALGQIGGDLARRTLKHYLEADNEALAAAANEALQELEFFHGDLDTFFGPPDDFVGEGEEAWLPDLRTLSALDDDDVLDDAFEDDFGDEEDDEVDDDDDDDDEDAAGFDEAWD